MKTKFKKTNTNTLKKIKKKKNSFLSSIQFLKKINTTNFNTSIDVSIHLNIDSKKTEQNIKSYAVLPYGNGKKTTIAAFIEQEKKHIAEKSGADYIGTEDLFDKIQKKKIKFDIVIATPKTMHIVGKLGTILGPKGLMPNIKFGTITKNIAETINNIKKGQIFYKNDKNGIIHAQIGKINFKNDELQKNFEIFISEIKKNKPSKIKGLYIKKIYLSATMSPGIEIDCTLYN
ncbi:50S ribosomal protein L1 [Buchnera aphidicola (Mollitrichosiphum nigrofasciatum)]|uniref:50S ribosomal protein L1 n=1 Tax=Buchnera aphidicola TaxID=9 RepID=UPI0031B8242E